ncbi:M56 family metallopeptidase [Acetatifactor muris]|jgi:bla regulator protein BlaR1|uniref:Regulatory protein BlaR1 n=1 Tax=Acetatifactor muris TaxID=879566 RepID=A0A2K4ZDE2_9FIRM|nr:M56 family metallopeptidase [Acetatifactor muris]MCI8799374.1 M56 family metallopeptidase [Lachnospiraceae bacterium]MCR2046933.1 M56 family metallopeptidase [Acetatifactor muris]SOY28478.1 Regulatory protein BlaR1 [Acetatifactor muris]
MLHLGMNMPFVYMAFYGTIMIAIVILLRVLLENRMPKFVFPVLWGVVLLRLLVPFSLSSPFSLPVPENPFLSIRFLEQQLTREAEAAVLSEDRAVLAGAAENTGSVETSEVRDIDAVKEDAGTVSSSEQGSAWAGDFSGDRGVFPRHVLPSVYLLGLVVTAVILGWQKYDYAGKLKSGLLMEHNETVNAMLREMDMGHVLVFTNDEIASPLVCGLRNPRIYLPTRMDFGNKELLRHILVHETMHIRRRDNWLKCIMLIGLVVHWYNPVVWLMSKCLSSDLETACDEAVLKLCGEEERKSYAFSLLSMAITGNRNSLLYSAFSKTEVERRVKHIVHYRKATVFVIMLAVLFTFGSTVAFATGGQAPFSARLTAYCFSSNCHWGGYVRMTRELSLGKNAQERAEEAVFSVLGEDTTGDPEILESEIRTALAEEFGVERTAFSIELSLILSPEEAEAEYGAFGLTKEKDGFWLYQNETVRTFEDRILGFYQSREEGNVDISVQRDRFGKVTSLTVWRAGDQEYDERTRKLEQYKMRSYGMETEVGTEEK